MRKIILLLTALVVIPTFCFADPLPNSEFSLGGLSVRGSTIDDARRIYGEPEIYTSNQYMTTYTYGGTVFMNVGVYGNGRIHSIRIAAKNGWATPAGLTVGMKKSTMFKLYGVETGSLNKNSGFYQYLYPHIGSGSGASMLVEVDDTDTIRIIEVGD